ncbi:HlyD family efflux transporter periplasmic adaptor subunit [Massilia sp. TW-1]|uniref:HlyD family efflux transporter periplasmic adaptor subunit n=2 Tax=Telluria antibiotica TaxID=2717319 RepID=A0ABX0P9S0_9BURK|nr:HlyD family efflux transporter periplasmic adaptor subunit [Telluria antibiotica]
MTDPMPRLRPRTAAALAAYLSAYLAILGLLSGCDRSASSAGPAETLAPRAWQETLEADGEIKAAASTPLTVPGSGWTSRVLVDMVPDGSSVRKGEVVARFDAPQARSDLSQADLELLRKTLAEEANRASAAVEQGVLAGDRAKVENDLALSRRYANVDLSVFARNTILDALADVGFLTQKRTYLDWKGGQVKARTAAQDAVLRSQRDSVLQNAAQQRSSLAALALVAPHDGVFLQAARWDGAKAQVGAPQMAGEPFGTLPDLDQLVAHFSVAERQADGLKPGLPVRVRLAGTGTELDLVVTRVGSSASIVSQESPVKYSDFDAAIATDQARKLGLTPGQALHGTVRLVSRASALTVPNIALVQDGGAYAVYTDDGGRSVKRKVELGQRGPVRSEIRSGLAPGARVVLLPPKESKS